MVKNIPEYAKDYKFIVATYFNNEYWFWGAFNEKFEAEKVAKEIDGKVFLNIF